MKKLTIITLTFVMAVLSVLPAFASAGADFDIPDDQPIYDVLFGIYVIDKMTKVSEILEKFDSSDYVTDRNGNILNPDSYVPNGALSVEMWGENAVVNTYIFFMQDVNCDAKITAADARLALRHSARLEKLDDIQFKAADVNEDGKVTAADARLILRKPIGPVNPNR